MFKWTNKLIKDEFKDLWCTIKCLFKKIDSVKLKKSSESNDIDINYEKNVTIELEPNGSKVKVPILSKSTELDNTDPSGHLEGHFATNKSVDNKVSELSQKVATVDKKHIQNAVSTVDNEQVKLTFTRENGQAFDVIIKNKDIVVSNEDIHITKLDFDKETGVVKASVKTYDKVTKQQTTEYLSTSLDGRYSLLNHTHTIDDISNLDNVLDDTAHKIKDIQDKTEADRTETKKIKEDVNKIKDRYIKDLDSGSTQGSIMLFLGDGSYEEFELSIPSNNDSAINSVNFSPADGNLTVNTETKNLHTSLDGRYALLNHSHNMSDVEGLEAHNRYVDDEIGRIKEQGNVLFENLRGVKQDIDLVKQQYIMKDGDKVLSDNNFTDAYVDKITQSLNNDIISGVMNNDNITLNKANGDEVIINTNTNVTSSNRTPITYYTLLGDDGSMSSGIPVPVVSDERDNEILVSIDKAYIDEGLNFKVHPLYPVNQDITAADCSVLIIVHFHMYTKLTFEDDQWFEITPLLNLDEYHEPKRVYIVKDIGNVSISNLHGQFFQISLLNIDFETLRNEVDKKYYDRSVKLITYLKDCVNNIIENSYSIFNKKPFVSVLAQSTTTFNTNKYDNICCYQMIIPQNFNNYIKDQFEETRTKIQDTVSTLNSVFDYKGSISTYNNLPMSNQKIGDTYNISNTGDNYTWSGREWDKLGGTVAPTPIYMFEPYSGNKTYIIPTIGDTITIPIKSKKYQGNNEEELDWEIESTSIPDWLTINKNTKKELEVKVKPYG